MARSFEDIMNSLPPERQQIINQGIEQLVAEEMTLQELRKAHEYSQKVLANTLQVNQATISKIERQTDMLISTLRSFVEAMGGNLEIIATFPNHPPIKLNQFEDLAEADKTSSYEESNISDINQTQKHVVLHGTIGTGHSGISESLAGTGIVLFDPHGDFIFETDNTEEFLDYLHRSKPPKE